MLAHSSSMPPLSEPQRAEYAALSRADRALVTPEAFARWSSDLAESDYSLADIVAFEKRRRAALATLRSTAELTDREWQLLRYLQRNEGRTCTYLMMARHLWSTPAHPVTARTLRYTMNAQSDRYHVPMIVSIQVLVHQIRRKLEIDPLRPQHLATIRGVGYRWYSKPPALDDGEDYEQRARETERERDEMHQILGITEGEYTVIERRDADGNVYETRFSVGPELDRLLERRQRPALPEGEPEQP
jgi:hypothetical protein